MELFGKKVKVRSPHYSLVSIHPCLARLFSRSPLEREYPIKVEAVTADGQPAQWSVTPEGRAFSWSGAPDDDLDIVPDDEPQSQSESELAATAEPYAIPCEKFDPEWHELEPGDEVIVKGKVQYVNGDAVVLLRAELPFGIVREVGVHVKDILGFIPKAQDDQPEAVVERPEIGDEVRIKGHSPNVSFELLAAHNGYGFLINPERGTCTTANLADLTRVA